MNEYKEFVIKTNKPVLVEKDGDIISAQLLPKHGDLIDRKEAISRIRTLKEWAKNDNDTSMVKACESIISTLKKLSVIVWES